MNNSHMYLKELFYLYCFLLILFTQLGCKIWNIPPKEKQNICYSDEMLEKSIKEKPDLQQKIDLQNQALRNYINSNSSNDLKSRASGSSNFIIPIVIYIVHNNGAENISDQQVHSQIDRLTLEFSNHGIEFCLASEENGTALPGTGPDPGIIRLTHALTNHITTDEGAWKALSPLPANRYLMGRTAYIFIFLVSSVVSVLPLTIGGLGIREVVFLEGAAYFSLDSETAVIISLLFYLITLVVSAIGAWYIFNNPLKKKGPVEESFTLKP